MYKVFCFLLLIFSCQLSYSDTEQPTFRWTAVIVRGLNPPAVSDLLWDSISETWQGPVTLEKGDQVFLEQTEVDIIGKLYSKNIYGSSFIQLIKGDRPITIQEEEEGFKTLILHSQDLRVVLVDSGAGLSLVVRLLVVGKLIPI